MTSIIAALNRNILLTCWSLNVVLFSFTEAFRRKTIYSNIPQDMMSIRIIIMNCLAVALFFAWTKHERILFRVLPFFGLGEILLYLFAAPVAMAGNITMFFVIDTIAMASCTISLSYGLNKLKHLSFKGAKRKRFDNLKQCCLSGAAVVGALLALFIQPSADVCWALFPAAIGLDNIGMLIQYSRITKAKGVLK